MVGSAPNSLTLQSGVSSGILKRAYRIRVSVFTQKRNATNKMFPKNAGITEREIICPIIMKSTGRKTIMASTENNHFRNLVNTKRFRRRRICKDITTSQCPGWESNPHTYLQIYRTNLRVIVLQMSKESFPTGCMLLPDSNSQYYQRHFYRDSSRSAVCHFLYRR